MSANFQKPSAKNWQDASGNNIPMKYISQSEKKKETIAARLHKQAVAAETVLSNLMTIMQQGFDEVRQMLRDELSIKKKVGPMQKSITWFNFDKSVKLEAKTNDFVKWDEALLSEALDLLNNFITSNMGEANELIQQLVKDAFSNRKKQVDSRKIFQILRYQEQVKNKTFQQACELLKKAQQFDKSKIYMRIWVKDEKGQYQPINLNFASL